MGQEKIARMSMLHYATESLAYMVAGIMDQGHKDYQLEAAVSKIFSSEAAWYVTDEDIQRAIKNPIGNFGLVFGEVSKRAGHAVGMTSVNHLAPHVHSNLTESAALTCKGVDAFGAAVEAALIKHGKNIIHEQFLLNRLANAIIDIYVSSCVCPGVLSRSLKASS